ncbi:unnamed protein product [Paramecium sonneborni]|uniref:Uncharacterized protein n=1 Tax=Paramecium sonneborni TaxID=65129 RepID=A0A8S1PIB5_9CILI|nr:unnamed protein product [Paramecium sonneborni]
MKVLIKNYKQINFSIFDFKYLSLIQEKAKTICHNPDTNSTPGTMYQCPDQITIQYSDFRRLHYKVKSIPVPVDGVGQQQLADFLIVNQQYDLPFQIYSITGASVRAILKSSYDVLTKLVQQNPCHYNILFPRFL